jgi:hypothetical protein
MALSLACVTAALQLAFLADMEQFIIGLQKGKRSTDTEDSLTYSI